MSFADLKNRGNSFAELSKKIQQTEKGGNYGKDERLWTLERDAKKGTGEAVIRFLPESDGSTEPFVTLYQHGFEHNGKWFIENCPTTIGEECPVCQSNSEYWNSGFESDKEIVKTRKRKKNYYANIYVVDDPKNPENNGKVFLFRFGVAIMRMIKSKISPEFESTKAVNVFDLWEGANLRLRASLNQYNMVTYENSEWESPSQLLPTDAQLEEVWRSQHNLEDLVSKDKFESYGELKARFNRVTNENVGGGASDDGDIPPPPKSRAQERFGGNTKPTEPEIEPIRDTAPSNSSSSAANEDDEIAKYKKMLGIG